MNVSRRGKDSAKLNRSWRTSSSDFVRCLDFIRYFGVETVDLFNSFGFQIFLLDEMFVLGRMLE
jgi:hypothetical protein